MMNVSALALLAGYAHKGGTCVMQAPSLLDRMCPFARNAAKLKVKDGRGICIIHSAAQLDRSRPKSSAIADKHSHSRNLQRAKAGGHCDLWAIKTLDPSAQTEIINRNIQSPFTVTSAGANVG